MNREWRQQALVFAGREFQRVVRNAWLLGLAAFSLLGGLLLLRFAATGSSGFLFLQVQLFLLPLFAVLLGCSSAHEDLEELPVLFSQPVHRGAFLCGKWVAVTTALAALTALVMGPCALLGGEGNALALLWAQGIGLSGVFSALGLTLGAAWQDRVRGLMAALLAWLVLVFGWDALAWLAVQTGLATRWPAAWVVALFVNPPCVFRVAALLALQDIPFSVPSSQVTVTWLLENTPVLTPILCGIWISLTLALGSRKLNQ